MGSIRHQPRTARRVTPAEEFDALRDVFCAKLRDERVGLVILCASLARTQADPAVVFLDITQRAHKLCGRAATFEIMAVARAAEALEAAALAAANSRAHNDDAAVWSALEDLVSLMGDPDADADADLRPRPAL